MNFLLPSPFDAFLMKQVPDNNERSEIEKSIRQALGDGVRLKKKTFGVFELFNLDLYRKSGAHRILFEKVKISNQFYFKLNHFVWCHNYPQPKNLTPTPSLDSTNGYELIISNQSNSTEESTGTMTYFQGNWFEPSLQQSHILNTLQMPQLVVGPPGSGKTFIIMHLMQEQALNFLKHNESGVYKMLYFTENPSLVKKMQIDWQNWITANAPDSKRIIATFITRDDYAQWYSRDILGVIHSPLTLDEILANHPLRQGIDLETVKEEFEHNAYTLNEDRKNRTDFATSAYKSVGQKHSLVDEQTRARLFGPFCKILTQLEEQGNYVPGVTPFQLNQEAYAYDLILVDEAQNEKPQTLMSLLEQAKANKILFFGDTLQNTQHRLCPLPGLAALCHRKNIALYTEDNLFKTLRMPPKIAGFANALVLLYHSLRKGRANNLAYSNILAEDLETQEIDAPLHYFHQADDSTFRQIGQNPKASAIVLREEDKDIAKDLIQGHHIFTPKEVGGLEFDLTFLFFSQETIACFEPISKAMEGEGITASSSLFPKENKSPQKQPEDPSLFSLLSALLISISRTKEKLWIYFEKPDPKLEHKVGRFLQWLKANMGTPETNVPAPVVTRETATPGDWLFAIHELIYEGALTQAKGDLIKQLQLSEVQANSYINYCQQKRPEPNQQTFEQWLKLSTSSAAKPQLTVAGSKCLPTSNPNTAELKPRNPSPETLPVIALSEKLGQWVESFYPLAGNKSNVVALCNLPTFYSLFFHHRMKNGLTLWLNLVLDKKAPSFLEQVSLTKQETKDNIAEYFRHAMRALKDTPLFLFTCELCKQPLGKLLNQQPLQIPSLSSSSQWLALISTPDLSFTHRTIIIEYLFAQKKTVLISQEQLEDGRAPSLLHTLFIEYPQETLLKAREDEFLIKNNLFQTITSIRHPDCGASLLYLFLRAGVDLPTPEDAKIIKALSVQEITRLIIRPITGNGKYKGTTPLHFIIISPALITPSVINRLVEKHIESFFTSPDGEGTFQGWTPISDLCSHYTGITLLETYWKSFKAAIQHSPARLFQTITCEVENQGATPFSMLCAIKEGRMMIETHWEDFHNWIKQFPQMLFQPITGQGGKKGVTPFGSLCHNATTITTSISYGDSSFRNEIARKLTTETGLLLNHWEDFKPWIEASPEALFQPMTMKGNNSTCQLTCPFIELVIVQSEEITLIETQWQDFKNWIESSLQAFFQPISEAGPNQGVTPFFLLCSCVEGSSFIIKHWDDFKRWIEAYPQSLFQPVTGSGPLQGGFSLGHLIIHQEKKSTFIKTHWDDFSRWIQTAAHLLFTPITEGLLRGNIPFITLLSNKETKELLKDYGDVFMPWIKASSEFLYQPVEIIRGPNNQADTPFNVLRGTIEGRLILDKWNIPHEEQPMISQGHRFFSTPEVSENFEGNSPAPRT